MLRPPVSLQYAVERESVRDASYHWDNRLGDSANAHQIVQFVWSGEGRFREDGDVTHRVGAGDLMLFARPDRSRYWYPAGARGEWVFSWANFRGLESFWADLRRVHGSVLHLGTGSSAAVLLRRMGRRFQERTFRDPWEAGSAVYQFVMSLAREAGELVSETGARLEQARAFLMHHPGGGEGVKEIAERFGYSREHFTRLFLERFGESPGRLLRDARLRNARALLGQSGFPLDRIAALSGFASAASLCRAFREETGESPGEWRKRARPG